MYLCGAGRLVSDGTTPLGDDLAARGVRTANDAGRVASFAVGRHGENVAEVGAGTVDDVVVDPGSESGRVPSSDGSR